MPLVVTDSVGHWANVVSAFQVEVEPTDKKFLQPLKS